jgi:predicted PurR-regulated permease PerM
MKTSLFFLVLIIIFGFLSFLILKPYLSYIIFAAILVFLTYPIYKKFKLKLRRKSLSAIILIILMILIVLIPIFYISTTLFFQTRNVLQGLSSFNFDKLENLEQKIYGLTGMRLNVTEDVQNVSIKLGETAVSYIMNSIPQLTKTVASIFIGFTIMIFSMFYFYVDGERIKDRLVEMFPFEKKYRKEFFNRIYKINQSLFLGIFLIALIQGIIAGIGYFLFQVPNPMFWAFITTIISIIPMLGAPWIYVPLSLYLMYNGSLIAGIGLFLYCLIFVSQSDNFIRPKIVRISSGDSIHPLTIILGVIGGVAVFGFTGVIIGPLILAFLMELLKIYNKNKNGN